MDSFSTILDVLILATIFGSGGYALYTYIRLRREWRIFNSVFLTPSECPPDECQDTDAYLEYVQPRLLILSIACFAAGLLFLPVALPNLSEIMNLGTVGYNILLFGAPLTGFVALVWYMFCQGKAAKRFWK